MLLVSSLIYVSLTLLTNDKRIEFSWACFSNISQMQYSKTHKASHISNNWSIFSPDRILSYHRHLCIPPHPFFRHTIFNIFTKELNLFQLAHLLRNKKSKYLILVAGYLDCSNWKIVQSIWMLWCLSLCQQTYIEQFHS